ncbi:hypothetical protein C1Y63_01155 [Corynebacterium sp. 13CS0277]|uniref:transposase n=1 Tax=Corynebacterium sp. 13CS0277 TaxID=2071994 RepID=UPI000D03A04A|nr:transposase [Corynebacterium sp. 13CS0277]PRQ12428.1 hypothetical protein C1Y63_01155 [Corynebacterium sp. 13CS0277]
MGGKRKYSDDTVAAAVRRVESGDPVTQVAADVGCSVDTVRGWVQDHRHQLLIAATDDELLEIPEVRWQQLTPMEQNFWVRAIVRRGLNLHDFPLVATLKRPAGPTSAPWFFAEWAILMVNFGGKTKAEMARQLGIHPSTLSAWMKEHDEYGQLLHPENYIRRSTRN